MVKLTARARAALPDNAFALPGRRYPICDKNHARDALARASEMFHRQRLTIKEYRMISEKAHAVLQGRKA